MILRLTAVCLAVATASAAAQEEKFRAPDTLVLKDGSRPSGLIVKNTATAVLLQDQHTETWYPKSDIVRILDQPDTGTYFTEANRLGDLPSWRVIANDLRANDAIKSLVEIPATAIDVGVFDRVPYKSFRANRDIEINIFGDPADPAGVELGIHGPRRTNRELQEVLRSYLAGFLTSRKEIAAIYSLDRKGGSATIGDITIEITPHTSEDAYGAWWISLFNTKDLAAIRVTPEEYAKLTKPVDELVDNRGRVVAKGWTKDDLEVSNKIDENTRVLMRGFYRDRSGVFRILTPKSGS